jgi:hypothetical protein
MITFRDYERTRAVHAWSSTGDCNLRQGKIGNDSPTAIHGRTRYPVAQRRGREDVDAPDCGRCDQVCIEVGREGATTDFHRSISAARPMGYSVKPIQKSQMFGNWRPFQGSAPTSGPSDKPHTQGRPTLKILIFCQFHAEIHGVRINASVNHFFPIWAVFVTRVKAWGRPFF